MNRNKAPTGKLSVTEVNKLKTGLANIKTEGVKYEKDESGNVIEENVMDKDQFFKLRGAIIEVIEYSDDVQFTRELNTIMRMKPYKKKNQVEYMEVYNEAQMH